VLDYSALSIVLFELVGGSETCHNCPFLLCVFGLNECGSV
jgi:hypothetical protein